MVSFIHFADAHVNNNESGKVKAGIPIRVLDVFKNFDLMVDYAIINQVDYVLFAGDMYLNRHPKNEYRTMVQKRIVKLSKAGIKVVMIPGNHDMIRSANSDHSLSEFRQLAPNNIYLVDRASTIEFDDLAITCIPWEYKPLTYIPPAINNKPHIGLAHCTLSNIIFDYTRGADDGETSLGKDFVVDFDYFQQFDYAAMGHIHKAQTWGDIVYPGSMELLTWGEAKDGSIHGFVHWVDGNWTQIPYQNRERVILDYDLDCVDFILPEPDPEIMYEITLRTNDPYTPLPEIPREFIDNAFNVKIKNIAPRIARYRHKTFEIDLDDDPTSQLETWFEVNDLEFDDDMRKLWTEIMTSV